MASPLGETLDSRASTTLRSCLGTASLVLPDSDSLEQGFSGFFLLLISLLFFIFLSCHPIDHESFGVLIVCRLRHVIF
jgi:hypothetical protein